MALSKETQEDTEFAKTRVMHSELLTDAQKKSIIRLLNVSMEATNGISTEEKIQKITEAIHGLVLTQTTFIEAIDKKIETTIVNRCASCKAYQHADAVELEKQKIEIIESWKKAHGIKDEDASKEPSNESKSWMDVIKAVAVKPAVWIFMSILVISPYGADIVKAILEFCNH